MEYLIPHGCQMLDQISLEGDSTCLTSRPETMQGVIVADRQVQPPVYDTGGGLPQDIH